MLEGRIFCYIALCQCCNCVVKAQTCQASYIIVLGGIKIGGYIAILAQKSRWTGGRSYCC